MFRRHHVAEVFVFVEGADFEIAWARHGVETRFAHSTASSMSLTSHIQKPATSSLVAEKGPSNLSPGLCIPHYAIQSRRVPTRLAGRNALKPLSRKYLANTDYAFLFRCFRKQRYRHVGFYIADSGVSWRSAIVLEVSDYGLHIAFHNIQGCCDGLILMQTRASRCGTSCKLTAFNPLDDMVEAGVQLCVLGRIKLAFVRWQVKNA